MTRILMIALLSLPMLAQAQVYKCNVGGKSVYQDRPCAGGKREDTAKLPPLTSISSPYTGLAQPAPVAAPAAAAAAPAAGTSAPTGPDRPSNSAVRSAIIANQVLPGMTAAEVVQAAGKYGDHRKDSGVDSQGAYEIWAFPQKFESFPFTVKLRDGVVTEYSSDDLRTLHR